jgi:uncharacterized membrane protein YkoI
MVDRRTFVFILALAASTGAAGPAFAKKGGREEERIRDAVGSGDATMLRDILETVSRAYPGEVLRIRLKGEGEDLHYRIRILQPDGRRIDIEVDARTGNIIKADGD